jgi:hypothetical protein
MTVAATMVAILLMAVPSPAQEANRSDGLLRVQWRVVELGGSSAMSRPAAGRGDPSRADASVIDASSRGPTVADPPTGRRRAP